MVAVTYYCPHCGALASLDRDAYLADKSVTPYPLSGWNYATPDEEYEETDGVRFVCGENETLAENGCGEPFYLSFVRFEDGKEIDPEPPAEYVEVATGVSSPDPRVFRDRSE